MERFADSMKLYEELQKGKPLLDRETEDIASNYSAAKAQETWTTGVGHIENLDQESYDVCFNVAYELMALGNFAKAEELLNRAASTLFNGVESDFRAMQQLRPHR